MKLDLNYFQVQKFTAETLSRYLASAKQSLKIAQKTDEPEVAFHFCYMALARIGIYHLAKAGYRVKSKPGHHQKIIEALALILNDKDIAVIGDKMRKDRNSSFYDCDAILDKEEIEEYLDFVKKIVVKSVG